MSLLAPVAVPAGRKFGDSEWYDYPYWHRAVENAMFGYYANAARSLFHAGLDFPCPDGTNIVAPETSVIEFTGPAPVGSAFDGGGIITKGKIAGGMHWVACHQSDSLIKFGQQVQRGQHIGEVGHTGHAYGSHCHFVLYTVTSSGAYLFQNPSYFLAGGKYAGSALIKPAPVLTGNLTATVGPGTVTGFHIPAGTSSIDGHKTVTFTKSSGAGTVHQGIPGYFHVEAGVFAGMYLITGKSGPFSVRSA